MTEVVIYTDGACSGNPGPGGWGVVMRWQGTEKEMYGAEPLTTNNRMELMAAIQALEALQRPSTTSRTTARTIRQARRSRCRRRPASSCATSEGGPRSRELVRQEATIGGAGS